MAKCIRPDCSGTLLPKPIQLDLTLSGTDQVIPVKAQVCEKCGTVALALDPVVLGTLKPNLGKWQPM